MLNFRQVDDKFCLSGGWTDIPSDAQWLEYFGIKAVLDLQITNADWNIGTIAYINGSLIKHGIEYQAIAMDDGENENIGKLFDESFTTLSGWYEKYTNSRSRILVKCGVGVSRSVAVLIHYYCRRDNMSFIEARNKIRRVDNYDTGLPISIDHYFEKWLKEKFPDGYYT